MQTLKLIKKYETYPEYKNSGVEWLNNLPTTWKSVPLRSVLYERREKNKDLVTDNILSVMKDIGVIRYEDKGDVGNKSSDNPSNYKIVYPNDIVVNSMNLKIGSVGISKELGVTSSIYIIYRRSGENVLPHFYNYVFMSKAFQKYVGRLGKGIMEIREAIKPIDLKSEVVPLPPVSEQENIIKYLDQKTVSIDQIIKGKEKLIELLKEKKTSFINDAVNNVSDFEEKLKYIAFEKNTKIDTPSKDKVYVGMENIESLTGKYLPSTEIVIPESIVNLFDKNDVLFGKLRPYLAKVYSPEFSGVCSGEFLVLKPKSNKISSRFLFYKLISRDFIKKVDDSTYGTRMPRANWQFIGNQVLVYPTLEVQSAIINKLDQKTKLYEEAINKVEESIEKLKEFKISLISNVVTGNIRV